MGFHNQEEGFKLQTWGCVFLTCCWGVDGVNTERVIIVVMWMLHIGLPCKVTHLLTKWGALDDVLLRYHSSTKRAQSGGGRTINMTFPGSKSTEWVHHGNTEEPTDQQWGLMGLMGIYTVQSTLEGVL